MAPVMSSRRPSRTWRARGRVWQRGARGSCRGRSRRGRGPWRSRGCGWPRSGAEGHRGRGSSGRDATRTWGGRSSTEEEGCTDRRRASPVPCPPDAPASNLRRGGVGGANLCNTHLSRADEVPMTLTITAPPPARHVRPVPFRAEGTPWRKRRRTKASRISPDLVDPVDPVAEDCVPTAPASRAARISSLRLIRKSRNSMARLKLSSA
uniref:Uncharacterized protein n=1 Tax=Arundo donax TaxID=35708 RepID=A0A0A8XZ06_ARUDO